MRSTKHLKQSEVFSATGSLSSVADQAVAAGFRYFLMGQTIFEIDAGRAPGSTLGMHALNGAKVEQALPR